MLQEALQEALRDKETAEREVRLVPLVQWLSSEFSNSDCCRGDAFEEIPNFSFVQLIAYLAELHFFLYNNRH